LLQPYAINDAHKSEESLRMYKVSILSENTQPFDKMILKKFNVKAAIMMTSELKIIQ
jgi:hypothetical protein